ncbi:MAG: hypothetical protein ACYDBP_03685 [Leptospirales bacterium]
MPFSELFVLSILECKAHGGLTQAVRYRTLRFKMDREGIKNAPLNGTLATKLWGQRNDRTLDRWGRTGGRDSGLCENSKTCIEVSECDVTEHPSCTAADVVSLVEQYPFLRIVEEDGDRETPEGAHAGEKGRPKEKYYYKYRFKYIKSMIFFERVLIKLASQKQFFKWLFLEC